MSDFPALYLERFQILISKEEAGTRLDYFLSKKFTYHSRTVWQKEINEGRIVVSGKKIKSGILLREGETVVYQPVGRKEPPVRKDYEILYEDEFFVAVNKPGDLPVHPAGKYRKGNLLTLLKESRRFENLFTVHRLDRETSGVVLFAKDSETASILSGFFSSGKVQKYYITKVYGDFPRRKIAYGVLKPDFSSKIRKKKKFFSLKFNFLKRNKRFVFESFSETAERERCLTYFKKIEFDFLNRNFETQDADLNSGRRNARIEDEESQGQGNRERKSEVSSFVLCKPITGRMHQIRAVLYGLGFPVLGDKLYGRDEEVFLEFIEGKNPDLTARLGMERQALHSYAIRFNHPITNQKMKIVASFPRDFR
ncbi:pseudouridine synthase [Leptospira santarosai]|uniref:pseudouridine synthase n=1 Tax=Leptospira santarosai TaxID=28183 RepID=UPI0026E2ABAD|nr:RluA family pseudouridine synthase [Leptospira santarosai]MDO6381667.1 RluA family pseudouridine synthase [Leptospira santarosai]